MTQHSEQNGIVHDLFIKTEHGAPMQSVSTIEAVAGEGLKGDQAYGRRSRQVLLVDLDKLEALNLEPGDLRENITVTGLSVDTLPIGSRLKSGRVELEIVDVCTPCSKLEKIRPGLMRSAENIRGMLAVVTGSGTLRKGDSISMLGNVTT
jgi:MOSC domain-containing protein YiiM